MEGEGNFVGVGCAPGKDALEFDGIVGDGADFHQFSLDGLGISHRKLQDDTEFHSSDGRTGRRVRRVFG